MNVLAVRFECFPLSETFIYDELVNDPSLGVKSYVYCKSRLNSQIFPYQGISIKKDSILFHRLLQNFLKRRFFTNKLWARVFINDIHRLACLIRKLDIKLIHAHFIEEALFALELKKIVSVPLVVSFHGGYDSYVFPQQHPRIFLDLMNHVDMALVRSLNMKEHFMRLGVKEDKMSVLYRGIDRGFWKSAGTFPATEKGIVISFIGRLVEKKGLLDALKAVIPVLKKHSHVHFHVFGSTDGMGIRLVKKAAALMHLTDFTEGDLFLREKALSLAVRSGVSDRIYFHGAADKRGVRDLLSKTHILLAPSHFSCDGDGEGIPGVMMEAQAMGIPVVATRHAGIPELIKHGFNGFLVEERDVGQLTAYLNHLVENSDERNSMGANGPVVIGDRFDLKDHQKVLAGIYARF